MNVRLKSSRPIEDGSLVSIVKIYRMENGKTELVFNFRESITPDDQGNIKWDVAWRYRDIKIIKVMWAQRENNMEMFFFMIKMFFMLLLFFFVYCCLLFLIAYYLGMIRCKAL